MPYFKVDELLQLVFSGKSTYDLPESTKNMLIDLESLLEITDTGGVNESSERKEYKSYDSRRSTAEEFTPVKYKNRYDIDSISTAPNHLNRDKKKRDSKQR